MATGKWTKETWTTAALQAIARGGIAAVAVDTLATELGATRGSFYWHFKDRGALLDAAMAAWEDLETTQVQAQVAAINDPQLRMRTLFRMALLEADDPIPGLEPAIYAQPDHPAVAPTLRRVTERRLRILTTGFGEMGLAPAKARRQAVLSYATYVGWLQLRRTAADMVPEVSTTGRKATLAVNHLVDQLIPANTDGTR
jgi:AcrR family transcriptional regulator